MPFPGDRLRPLMAAAIIVLAGGCAKTPVATLDLPVSKGDWADYYRSMEAIDARQTPEERTEFAQAIQELKYQAMAGGLQPGPDVSASIRDQIAGQTVRDVLVLGHTIKLDRKREEEKALVRSIRMNRRRYAKPGDTESAAFLVSVNAGQDKQLTQLRAEIGTIEARLDVLNPTREKPPVVVSADGLDESPVSVKPETRESGK